MALRGARTRMVWSLNHLALSFDRRGAVFYACLFLSGGGVYELAWHFLDKRKWLQTMSTSKSTGSLVEIRFEDGGIDIQGPYSQGHMDWAILDRAISTPQGMSLWTDKGVHIYVRDSGLTPKDAKVEILERIHG